MKVELGIPEISIGVILLGIFQFLASLWISERLKASLQKENTVFLENLRWDIKVREQAERVAEYMAIARALEESSPAEEYRRANQLNWELAMWLPEDLYKAMVLAIAKPSNENNPLSVVVEIRKYLLGKSAGKLVQDNIGFHAPGVGNSPTTKNKIQ